MHVCGLITCNNCTIINTYLFFTGQFEYVLGDKNEKVKLGEGSYGTVYSARDSFNRDIAVKEIPIKNTE